jgi:transmembrane sensor
MMSERRLSTPVRAHLDDRLPEGRVHSLWRGIDARRGRRGVPVPRAWALALGSAVAASALAFWTTRPSDAGALGLADGREVPAVIDVVAPASFTFGDGSRMDVSAGGHLDVLEATGRAFGLALRRGETEFDVHPGGPRTWRIECGDVTVEVVGTHFTVARTTAALRVAVQRGAVLVRGDAVPDRVVRLSAGESMVIPLQPARGVAAREPSPVAVPAPTATSSDAPSRASDGAERDPGAPATEMSRRRPGTGGESVVAVASGAPLAPGVAGGSEAAASSTAAFALPEGTLAAPTADGLLDAADAARKAGRFADAARLFERALAAHPAEDRAALAEFSLGRLYLDSMGDPSAASRHFARAVSRNLPATLAEDARARLVEALARSGDSQAARDAAARYRALYPSGRRLRDVDQWAPGAR